MNIVNEGKEVNRQHFSTLMLPSFLLCVFACQLHEPSLYNSVMIVALYNRKVPKKVDRTTTLAQMTGAKENSGTIRWPAALDPVLELPDPL